MRKIAILILPVLLVACASYTQPKPDRALPVDEKAPLAAMVKTAENTRSESMKKTRPSLQATLNAARPHESTSESGIYPLKDGIEAFAVRNALIKNAQHSLDLQYYSLHRGLSSRLLIREMVLAADRGVKIRILVDDMSMLGRDHEMTVLSAHPNIEVRIFNPIRRFRSTLLSRMTMFALNLPSQHRRMHNKVWLADGVLGITGGRNLGDRYFNAAANDNFSDLDVLLTGQVVRKMSNSFDEYWNSPQVVPVEAFAKNPTGDQTEIQHMIFRTNALTRRERVARHPYLQAVADAEQKVLPAILPQMSWGNIDFFADKPEKVNLPALHSVITIPAEHSAPFNALISHIQKAQKEVLIISPYFIPGENLSQLLASLVKKGVRVALLTNSLESNDVPLINGPYGRARLSLLQAGVEIYELRGFPSVDKQPQWRLPIFSWQGSRIALHAKAAVIDGETSFVGSMNLDPRSIIWNTEVGIMTQQRPFADKLRQLFVNVVDRKYSYRVTLDSKGRINWSAPLANQPNEIREPGNFWRRLQRNIALPIFETFL